MANYILPPQFVYSRIADGDGYLVPALLSVPANDSANVHIRNPHEDKVMWLAAMQISIEGNNEFYIHDDLTSVTDGDPITIQNALMDSGGGAPDSGPFEAYKNTEYSSAQSYPVGFTATEGPTETNNIEIVATAMEPDRQMIIEIENKNGSAHTAFFGALILTSY
jgi:hypothetical protein